MRKVICALVAIRGSNSSNMSVYSSLCSFAFLTLAFAWLAAGKDCKTLDGKWYNQLGDEIYLKHGSDGRLLGEYRTKYAGEPHSAVLGEYHPLIVYLLYRIFFNSLEHDIRKTILVLATVSMA